MRRVSYIEESDDEKEEKVEEHKEQLVLRVNRKGSKPFHEEWTMCETYLWAIIDYFYTARFTEKCARPKSRN